MDTSRAYETVVRIRRFEQAQARLWAEGLVPGELHSGIGEEAVAAGVVGCLRDGDAMALDHRGTPALVARGVDLESLLLEVVGAEEGLCGGRGGHMHLLAPEVLAFSDGIVGSSGPTACGLALAGLRLRPGCVAVAFFGEGAVNQGMLLESWNLAVAWRLPVLFVCKDNSWSITTRSRDVRGGSLLRRARAFGLPADSVAGWKVRDVADAAGGFLERARAGHGPALLHARVHRPGGHFEGDPMLRVLRDPLGQAKALGPGLVRAALARPGATPADRATAAGHLLRRFAALGREQAPDRCDPVRRTRRLLGDDVAAAIDARIDADVRAVVDRVRSVLGGTPQPSGGPR